jgi:hypothetical protein
VNSELQEKLDLSSLQTSWIEEKISLFNKKKENARTIEEVEALEKEGVEILRLIQQELEEIERLEKDA